MENVKLRRLAVFVENEEREDVVIIFAEPCLSYHKFCGCKFKCYVQEIISEEDKHIRLID